MTQAIDRGRNLTREGDALQRGVREIVLTASEGFGNLYAEVDFQVIWTRPNGSEIAVDGFYDGASAFRVRARSACDAVGEWRWRSLSNHGGLNGKSGSFRVIPSRCGSSSRYRWCGGRSALLVGKLRVHPKDPRQFAYDNGEWFPKVRSQMPVTSSRCSDGGVRTFCGDGPTAGGGLWRTDPVMGAWQDGGTVVVGRQTLVAPGPGDWVLLLKKGQEMGEAS